MSKARFSSRLPERNPATQKMHNRQTFWQITLPLGVGGAIVLTFAVLSSFTEGAAASRWADISLIFLIIPLLFASLLFLAVTAALIYGLARLLKVIPAYALSAQALAFKMERRVRAIADALTEPVFKARSAKAGLGALRRTFVK
jgi:predicted PurR-regulated permease PerM